MGKHAIQRSTVAKQQPKPKPIENDPPMGGPIPEGQIATAPTRLIGWKARTPSPEKVQLRKWVDPSGDGKITAKELFKQTAKLAARSVDADGDGKLNLKKDAVARAKQLYRAAADADGDGVPNPVKDVPYRAKEVGRWARMPFDVDDDGKYATKDDAKEVGRQLAAPARRIAKAVEKGLDAERDFRNNLEEATKKRLEDLGGTATRFLRKITG